MMKDLKLANGSLIGAIIAGIAASLCCVGPLVLLALGISGAWISTLTHLEFLRPFGIAITLFFLVLVFWKLYITPRRCSVDQLCGKPTGLRSYRIIFWVVTVLLLALLAFPWYAFLFY
ncbi:mercuric transporter MerT family protein [Legionella israelensis]|uniref:mercuric transporter MerT family protein n=1 Tax=Legionella israelensis TaxID=454 RepID=UPI001FD5ABF8|nr:mercuric transporter MerT family protein [Legionella israelensis]